MKTKINKKYKKTKTKLIGGGNNNIRPGVSGTNVVVIKMKNGKEGIIKKMSPRELELLQLLQGDNVVKILEITDDKYPIMEKLKHIDLYDKSYYTNNRSISNVLYPIKYKRLNNNNTEFLRHPVILPSKTIFRYLLDLLNAIDGVNTKGYIWGDLKTNNMGISMDDDKLYIFDFGEARKITKYNNYLDLLAFAKFFYNILVNKEFFQPGRDYDKTRWRIYQQGYQKLIDLLQTDDIQLKIELMNIFSLTKQDKDKDKNNDQKIISDDNIKKIYNSFRQYLQTKI